jgi:hypothetical protein
MGTKCAQHPLPLPRPSTPPCRGPSRGGRSTVRMAMLASHPDALVIPPSLIGHPPTCPSRSGASCFTTAPPPPPSRSGSSARDSSSASPGPAA